MNEPCLFVNELYRQLWLNRLDALEQFLNEEE
jgi:hypothetical protein